VSFWAAGTCTIHADQDGNGDFTAGHATRDITVDAAPEFTAATPPLQTTYGAAYSYDFDASGTPDATYALAPGAPKFLHIDSTTGVVTGTVPERLAFAYRVIATNTDSSSGSEVGTATAGPFKVVVGWPAVTLGRPTIKRRAPSGFYLSHNGNVWRVIATHPGTAR
jgi:hypothetical protein